MKQLLKNAKIVSMFIFVISFLGCTDDESIFPTVTSGFTYTVNEDTGTVTFINISEDARTYAWNFGDGSSSTEINPIKTYTATGTYTVTLTASSNAGASDSSEDNVSVTITEVPTGGGGDDPTVATSLPIDFESNETLSGVFEEGDGVTGVPIANPDQSGINTSDTVYEFTKATDAAWYSGLFQVFPSDIDLSASQAFTFKIWSPKAGINVRLQLEKEGGGPVTYQLDQTVATADEWVSVTFDFTGIVDPADGYDKIVIFPDYDATNETAGDGSVYYVDDIEQGAGGGQCTDTMLELPIDFDCSSITYDFVTFNGASFSIIDNPQLSGINDVASKVGEIVNIGGAFEGGAFTLDTPVDFATDKAIAMKFYSTVAVPLLLKFEGAGAPIETTADHGGTGWEQLTFTFTSSEQFGTLVLFVDGPGTTAGTFYIDDIEQTAATGGGTTCTPETSQSLDATDFDLTFQTDPGASVGSFDAVLTTIANPDFDNAVNPSCQVGQIDRSGSALFANNQIEFTSKFDFNANAGFKLKVWSPVAGTNVLLKLEDKADAGINTEVGAVTTTASAWEELTFDFASSESGKYDKIILFFELNTNTTETYYIDDFMLYGTGGGGVTCTPETSQSLDATDFDLTFQTDPGASVGSFDAVLTTIANPDFDNAVNPSCQVGQIDRSGSALFANNQIEFDSKFDFNANAGFKLKVWSPVAGTNVLVKLEDKADAGINTEVVAVTTTASAWEELTFDFASSESGKYDKIILFFELNTNTTETYYIDDFGLYGTGGGGGSLATFPLDFEDGVNIFNAFEGATVAVIDNPQTAGNPSSKVMELVKPVGVPFYAGINSDQTLNGPSIDLANGFIFKVKVWSPKAGINVRMRLEQEPGVIDPPAYEIFQTLGNANEWVTLTFDFSSQAMSSYAYTRLVLNTDWDTDPAGGETYYIDDITQE